MHLLVNYKKYHPPSYLLFRVDWVLVLKLISFDDPSDLLLLLYLEQRFYFILDYSTNFIIKSLALLISSRNQNCLTYKYLSFFPFEFWSDDFNKIGNKLIIVPGCFKAWADDRHDASWTTKPLFLSYFLFFLLCMLTCHTQIWVP